MRKKRITAILLAAVLMAVSCVPTLTAEAATQYIVFAPDAERIIELEPGTVTHVVVPVIGKSMYIHNPTILVKPEEGAPFTASDVTMTRKNIQNAVDSITAFETTFLEFDLTVKDTAQIGIYGINIQISFTGYEADYSGMLTDVDITETLELSGRIRTEKMPIQLTVDQVIYDASKAGVGNTFDLMLVLKNEGEIGAYNVLAGIDFGSTGMSPGPGYTVENKRVGDLRAGGTARITFPITVLPNAEEGFKAITVNLQGKDADGNTVTFSRSIYITLLGADETESDTAKLRLTAMSFNEEVLAGSRFDLMLTAENIGGGAASKLSIKIEEGVGISSGILPRYATETVELEDLAAGAESTVTLPLQLTKDVTEGAHALRVVLTYQDGDKVVKEAAAEVYITVLAEKEDANPETAKLRLTAEQFNQEINVETETEIGILLENIGKEIAKEVELKITAGADVTSGILPVYTTDSIPVADIDAAGTIHAKLPVLVTKDVSGGLHVLTVQASYLDSDEVRKTSEVQVYLTIISKDELEETMNDVTITNVVQSPDTPQAGEEISVSFDVVNKGNKAITAVQASGMNLSAAGFEPLSNEPFQAVGTIEAGSKKNVTMKFKVGEQIAEGVNSLTIGLSWRDADDKPQESNTSVYILNVKNGADTGKPKLIVSDYASDVEDLLAGSTFNFSFVLKNTHATKSAKNIKITVTQAENVFSATKGSNTFYIDRIDAGQEIESVLNMKVKNGVTTAAYDVSIKVEYEYDDMSKMDEESGGVTETNTIKLVATELAKPTFQSMMMYDTMTYDTPTVNSAAYFYADFYNMSSATLTNVYVTVGGDFSLSTGEMKYIGSVSAYGSEYMELEVIPLVAGSVTCLLELHYEDSNGDEIIKEFPYETFVNEASSGWVDGGMDDWGGGDIDIWNPGGGMVEVPKEPILPLWLFLVIQGGILVLLVPITRGILISIHKSKLRKQGELE